MLQDSGACDNTTTTAISGVMASYKSKASAIIVLTTRGSVDVGYYLDFQATLITPIRAEVSFGFLGIFSNFLSTTSGIVHLQPAKLRFIL